MNVSKIVVTLRTVRMRPRPMCTPWWWFTLYVLGAVLNVTGVVILLDHHVPILLALGAPATLSAVSLRVLRQVAALSAAWRYVAGVPTIGIAW